MTQPAILAVLPDERFTGLVEDLKASGATVLHVFSCAVARRILDAQVPICLIVTIPRLTDGSWRGLLTTALSHGSNPQIMVIAEEMDGSTSDFDMGECGMSGLLLLGAKVLSQPAIRQSRFGSRSAASRAAVGGTLLMRAA